MAGERLYSEFKNDVGAVYRVSIYDTNSLWNEANKTAFTLGADGFTLSYSGNNEQQHQPIIGSSCSFTLYENAAAHTQTLDLLYSHPEGRLLLEVYLNPDTDNDLYWRGVILADQVERNDEPFPTAVRLTASDDLGNLKDIDFSTSLGDVGVAGLGITKHIVRCLGGLRTYSRWADGVPILRYINDTELHSAEDDTDPLAEILGTVPVKILDDGSTEAYSCYDILSSLATCFNARVFQSYGVFWFWPINVHQRVADNDAIVSLIKQVDKDADSVAWTISDILWFSGLYKRFSNTDYTKLAGHVFTHLPPVKSVERTRRFNGNMYVVRGNDDTVVTTGNNITLADSDRTYEVGTKFRVSGSVEFQVSPDAGFDFGLPASRVHIEIEIMLKADAKYYQPEEWTTDSADRYVIDLTSFDRSNGCNINTAYAFVTDELPTEEDGLDVTAVVKFINEDANTNVTSAFTSEDFFVDLGVEVVDDNGSNADLITYRATHNNNTLVLDQGEVLFGDNIAHSAQGKLYTFGLTPGRIENDWKSSQTAGPLPLHRLGVNEALARQKYATKIHRGTVYKVIEMWQTMIEDSEYYVPFELSTNMNMAETTVERYKISWDSSGITSADDPPRADGIIRGGQMDLIANTLTTVTQQTQQPKLTVGGFPDGFTNGRAMQPTTNIGPLLHRITLLEHDNTTAHTIGVSDMTYVYMNTWTGTVNGFGRILLPKVADSEGRMFRFMTDSTISANDYYRVQLISSEIANGVTIDGNTYVQMDRPYDGITIMCHAGQWYTVQRKSK